MEPEEILEVVDIPDAPRALIPELEWDSDSDSDLGVEDEPQELTEARTQEPTNSENSPVASTATLEGDPITSPDDYLDTPSVPGPPMLPTPRLTPATVDQLNSRNTGLDTDPTLDPGNTGPSIGLNTRQNTAPRAQEISGDLSEENVIEDRTRRRRQAYLVALEHPEKLPGYFSAFNVGIQRRLHRDQLPPTPRTWKELLKHPHCEGFLTAATKEYKDLERRNTFKHVPKTPEIKTLPLLWVFTYKFDTDGFLVKFKARLCVRGDLQDASQEDTYAATLAARIFRTLMAIAAAFDLEARQYDAVSAFTNSILDETVHCKCPEGFEHIGLCLLLLRALYGLRRSPLLWLKEFSKALQELGLKEVPGEPCLYANDWLIVFFYVDDIVTLCRKEDLPKLQLFEKALMERYEIRSLGELIWFLGIRIIRDRPERKIWLCQDSYIDKITRKFNLEYHKPASTPLPMEELVPHVGQATPQEIYAYQQRVGSLNFAAVITRPDIAYSTSKLSEFLQNPSPKHLAAADQAISYLNGTKTLAIQYATDTASTGTESQQIFLAASDAAFADDKETRRSTGGYLFKLFGGPTDWKSAKQKTVTTSSTEAELLALTYASKETIWWRRFFQNICFNPGHDLAILCDNHQTIRLVTKDAPKLVTKLRHVDIHQHWLRQEVQEGRIQVNWIPTNDMPADGLTKTLPRQRHECFIQQLGLVDIGKRLKGTIV
jgi:hypothetical protein